MLQTFKIAISFGLILAIAAGIWLDQMPVLDQTQLFIIFQLVSFAGILTGIFWWLDRAEASWFVGLLIIIAAIIGWRVAYFPVMVFAGWIATLGEQLQLTLFHRDNGAIIYPIFLLAMFFMHLTTVWAAGAVATLRQKKYFVVSIPAFVVAVMVSFSTSSDLTLLPDYQTQIDEPLPSVKLPVSNPYLPALEEGDYTIAQRVFIFSAGSIYTLIPESPWSKAVKGTIEESFRLQPHSSTTQRILEHYLAYHVAHARINCESQCG